MYKYLHKLTHTQTCIYIYINIYLYVCVCMHMCVYVSIYMYIYECVDTHTHTHINEYLKFFYFQNNVSNFAKNNEQVQEMKTEKLIIHSALD